MLTATITLDAATDRLWDVVVVGAGPAGSLAARVLAARNCRTLLIDKSSFPRAKVCGGCVNHRAQAALESAGLGDLLSELRAAPVDTFTVASNGRQATIPLPTYYGVTREVLDEALAMNAIEAGAEFLPQTRVVETGIQSDHRTVSVSQGETHVEIKARVVIAASGLGTSLAGQASVVASDSRIGAGIVLDDAPDEFASQCIYMACGKDGYVGLTRVEDGRVDIAAAFDPAFIRNIGGLGPAAANVFEQAGFPVWNELSQGPWRGTPALTRANTAVAAPRMYIIGDAAGYVEPFTGEGIACACTTGVAVAPIAAAAAQQSSPALEREWQRQYKRIVTRRQYLCYALAQALRRPALTTTVIRTLNRMPQLAKPFVTTVNATPRLNNVA